MSARRHRDRQGGRGAAGILVGLVAATGVLAAATSTGAEHLAESPPLVIAVTDPAYGVTIAPDGPMTGYDREARFGAWARTGYWCDTRDRVLARDLTAQSVRDGCDVQAGTLRDPYSGAVVTGPTRALDVDHLVPEALAWRTGAARWTDEQRRAYGNDLDVLVTTTAAQNRSKGDSGVEAWQPALGRCDYARHFGAILRKYGLTASPERVRAMRSACPS